MVTDITADVLPAFDVVVEATGQPGAAAAIAEWAIDNGCHVIMASREAGIVVGPILNLLANQKGVVYMEVEGDQPSLLIGLNSWAETLGLEVLAAGKSSEYDFVLEEDDTLCWREHSHQHSRILDLWQCDDGDWQSLIEKEMPLSSMQNSHHAPFLIIVSLAWWPTVPAFSLTEPLFMRRC